MSGGEKVIPLVRAGAPPTGYVIEASCYDIVLSDLYEVRAQVDAAIALLETVRPARRPKVVRKRPKASP